MLLTFLIIFCLTFLASPQNTCSAYCDFYFNGVSTGLGCTAQTSTSCTHCFTQLFYLSSTSCLLRTDTIYNSTSEVPLTGWAQNNSANIYLTYTTPFQTFTNQYMRFNTQTLASINYTIPSTNGHYGFRCRFWVYYDDTVNNRMYFYINNSYELYLTPNFSDNSFFNRSWIQTTQFISYSDPIVQFAFKRNDSQGSVDPTGFRQLIVIIAECVPGCSFCTSLDDCSSCTGATYLNNLTSMCVNECPDGMFESPTIPNFCDWCEPQCSQCDISSTNCQKCTDTGPSTTFLFGTTCYYACPNGYQQNYDSHTCQCPSVAYYQSLGSCYSCHEYCQTCFGSTQTSCSSCNPGYYLQNGTNTCSIFCPAGQYYRPGVQIPQCYLCDAGCNECINSSTTCTSCVFISADKFLYNYTCLTQCPDGYQNNTNTFVCDQCALDTYSYKGTCISECPQHYTQNLALRSCVLSDNNGYPINITASVSSNSVLELSMELQLGLSATNQTDLQSDWSNRIKLYLIEEDGVLVNRLLQTQTPITLGSFNFEGNTIILTTSNLSATELYSTHSFYILFSDNLYSTDDVMYTISSTYSIGENPQILQQFYSLNLPYFYIIIIPLFSIAILILLFRIKYTYYAWVQFIHCLQLMGLTIYALFSNSLDLNLYSFVIGLDYSNFSFIYNAPKNLISACTSCVSFTGYAFVQGDMNYLRMMGSVLELWVLMGIVIVILVCVQCSKRYGKRLYELMVYLTMIKIFHSIFSSWIYTGLNMNLTSVNEDFMIVGTYFITFILLMLVFIQQYMWKKQHKFFNVRIPGLIVYTLFLTVFSLAPVLIAAIFVTLTFVQAFFFYIFEINDFGAPEKRKKKKEKELSLQVATSTEDKPQQTPCEWIFHKYFLLTMKPITSVLITTILMIDTGTTVIIVVCSVVGVLFIILIVDTIMLYVLHTKKKKTDIVEINQTQQNLKENEKQNQKVEQINVQEMENEVSDENDDDIVDKRFKNRKQKMVAPK